VSQAPRRVIPAQRPVGTGELVAVEQMAAYRARHGLRIVRAAWPAWSPYPIVYVEAVPAPAPTEAPHA
jgi:hypothetical protein